MPASACQPRRLPSILLLACLAVAGCGGPSGSEGVVARAREAPDDQAAARRPIGPVVERAATGGVLVDVAGLVRRPGIYRFAAGARVHEAIAAAGGARPGADLASINRAAALVDGQQVLVAARGRGVADAGARAAGTGGPVSINRADAAGLDALPGIGPVTAERIVAEREQSGPFTSLDDLDRVPGIGPGTIAQLDGTATT